MKKKYSQDEIVNHLKSTGYFFQNSEIYGGLANSWDYGPLGSMIKKNIKDLWWEYFVTKRTNILPLDSNIIYNPNVWKASGHLDNFSDPLIDCKKCKNRFRVDKLINDFLNDSTVNEKNTFYELQKIIQEKKIICPICNSNNWTEIRNFNLMFETNIGTTEGKKNHVYLRPETAQGIFVNFKNIQRTMRRKIPFGVAQIGKSFRNEITPSNFIYRSREFEQMELEYFTNPKNESKDFNDLLLDMETFIIKEIGISKDKIKQNEYKKDEIAHYSKKTVDLFFEFPHGWSELCGISNRGNFDLKNHSENSKKDLEYFDELNNIKYFPSIIEPSMGLDRLVYAALVDAFEIQEINEDSRILLSLDKKISPYRFCVLPLTNKLKNEAKEFYEKIVSYGYSCSYDETGSIGKRYRRQDAIGTYECITFDFDSIENGKKTITIRNRDTMKQDTIKIDKFLEELRIKDVYR